MSGFIKLHRNILEWEWYDDANTFRLFIHCLLRANHKERKWRGVTIDRGQFYTSLDTLAEETGLTPRQIRTSLDRLKTTGELSSTNMRRGRMVTVVKYENYQGDVSQTTAKKSVKCQASDRLTTANKNDKNNKKENIYTLDYGNWPLKPDEEFLGAWQKNRQKRRVVSVTQRIVDRMAKELNQAIEIGFTAEQCFEQIEYRGWASFEANWMEGKNANGNSSNQQNEHPINWESSFIDDDTRAEADRLRQRKNH